MAQKTVEASRAQRPETQARARLQPAAPFVLAETSDPLEAHHRQPRGLGHALVLVAHKRERPLAVMGR